MITQYPSVSALAADYRRHMPIHNRHLNAPLAWFGGETVNDSLRFAEQGDTSLVAEAETLLADLELSIETPRQQWSRAPAGAFASVPDVLAGLPTPMRRLTAAPDDHSPITILSCLTISAGITAKHIRQRGTVILALTLALSRIRPINLSTLTITDGPLDGTGENVITVNIDTKPMDLATACYVLTSAGFVRRLTYGIAAVKNGFNGGWPRDYGYGRPNRDGGTYFDRLVPRLGLDPVSTLIIPAAEFGDPLIKSPLTWLKTQITRFAPDRAPDREE
jgi:hypothetical protein